MARRARHYRSRVIDERTSGRDDHPTPAWLVKRIAAFSSSHRIDLDPAGARRKDAPTNRWSRRVYRLDRGDDGLRLSWRRFGLVFVNPPYGTAVRIWAQKCVAEFFQAPGRSTDECFMLVAARVDARWYKFLWRHANAVLKFDKRIQFVGEAHGAKFPNALFYFGRRARRFAQRFGDLGLVIANVMTAVSREDTYRSVARLYFAPSTWGNTCERLRWQPSSSASSRRLHARKRSRSTNSRRRRAAKARGTSRMSPVGRRRSRA